jgi:hypothetical protein
MAAVELGVYPFSNDSSTLMSDAGGIEEKVQTSYGIVKVSIYGNRKKQPILTFHDLGMDADNNFQNFFQLQVVLLLNSQINFVFIILMHLVKQWMINHFLKIMSFQQWIQCQALFKVL